MPQTLQALQMFWRDEQDCSLESVMLLVFGRRWDEVQALHRHRQPELMVVKGTYCLRALTTWCPGLPLHW